MIQWEPGMRLEQVDRLMFLQALQFHKGNKTHAARALGVSLRTIRNRIRDCDELAAFREDQRLANYKKSRITQG